MRCQTCGAELEEGDRYCPLCGASAAAPPAGKAASPEPQAPTSAPAAVDTPPVVAAPADAPPTADDVPPSAPAPPPAGDAPSPTVGTADLRAQLAQRWKQVQGNPVRVAVVAAIGAFLVVLVVSAVLALGVVKLLEGQMQGGEEEELVRGLFGSLVVFVTKYFVYAFNWLPVHLDMFAGLGGDIGARQEAKVHAAIVAGLPAVAFVLHRAGRWAARQTTTAMDERAALTQGGVIGAGYALLLVAFATLAAGNLKLQVIIFEGRVAIGPNRLWAFLVATAVGAFFAAWGSLAATGRRPWEELTRYAAGWLDWLVSAVAVMAAWAAGQVVACVVGAIWLIQQLATTNDLQLGDSNDTLSQVAVVVGAVVYALNLTTVLVLRGMGVPLHQVDGNSREAVELAPLVQVGATLVALLVLVLAGYLARAAVRRRYDTVRVVTRVAVCFAVLMVVLARVALVRGHGGGETSGVTAASLWVFVISLVEAGVLGMVGAQLAERGSLPIERVPGLRWFAGPVLGADAAAEAEVATTDTEVAEVVAGAGVEHEAVVEEGEEAEAPEESEAPRGWNRALIAGLAALVILPLLFFTVVPAVAGRESPATAVRRYLEHLDAGNAAAMARDVKPPEGQGPLLTTEAAAAMVRENPRDIEDVEVGETRRTGDTTLVDVTYRENGREAERTFEVTKAEGRRRFFFWPVWVVVPPTSRLSVDVPAGGGEVTVDGIRVPARAGEEVEVDVFDGVHQVRLAASGLLEAAERRVDTSVDDRVTFRPRLSDKGVRAVKDAVMAHFQGCAKNSVLTSRGCPQQVFPRGSEQQNVTWTLEGDPTSSLRTELRSDGSVTASGTFSMTVTYDWTSPGFFGPPETGRETDEDSGSYTFRFTIEGERVRLVSTDAF